MPASQLKRLKTSLREQGVTGPQKSKKQKKTQKGSAGKERVDRNTALQQIRDSFNPFELRKSSRPEKFPSASNKSANNGTTGRYKDVLHRPGVSKSAGEDMRRATLLPEMQRRNKVGGLVDRRIGEGDVGMTPEERAVERFAKEKEQKKGGAVFDLEASDDEGGGFGLTHGGRGLDELQADDFNDALSNGSDSDGEGELMRRKRRREEIADEERELAGQGDEEPEPERKKTKKEVMEEVIAKSKLHKYERQKAKEDDEDIREELDNGMNDMLALLRGHKAPNPAQEPVQPEASGGAPSINADRQRMIDGMDRSKADKEYESRLRQYAQDTRAAPSERTKTEEEKAAAEAERLKNLEAKRMKRMKGEEISEDEGEKSEDESEAVKRAVGGEEDVPDEAAEFGFTSSTAQPKPAKTENIVLDDEDEFALDDNLIASGSDVDDPSGESESEASESESEEDDQEPVEDEEDEFVQDVLGDGKASASGANAIAPGEAVKKIAYTYPCPRSHTELLDVVKDAPPEELPTIIQRIRALHHPSLSSANKEAMADFTTVLVEHLAYMGNHGQPLAPTEQLIRHLHSLSRTYVTEIATAFRAQLQSFHERGQLTNGDMIILTAIGSIYPTSDHFHQVVTPAITLMARWLGMTNPTKSTTQSQGTFLVRLCVSYQKLSKRYIPEAVRFTTRALSSKPAPVAIHLTAHLENITLMSDLWSHLSAFPEIFTPLLPLLKLHPSPPTKKTSHHLSILLTQARLHRRPLLLHNHKPSAIRQSIPKFEESFDPTKHYDPDKERSDASKLQKEYKRERKGALRELRKDANFVAREQLREKRERDAAYEKKYRRLVAEIQGEEGKEAKGYEREKMARKGKR